MLIKILNIILLYFFFGLVTFPLWISMSDANLCDNDSDKMSTKLRTKPIGFVLGALTAYLLIWPAALFVVTKLFIYRIRNKQDRS